MAAVATAAQIARNGHIAALLREYMARQGMSVPELAVALGKRREHCTFMRHWVAGTTAPAPAYRTKLGKLLGVKPDALLPRKNGEAAAGQELVPIPVGRPLGSGTVPVRIAELLSVTFLANGTTRMRMDATVPTEQALVMLETLKGAGALARREDDDHAGSG